jgi:hypothetical protein
MKAKPLLSVAGFAHRNTPQRVFGQAVKRSLCAFPLHRCRFQKYSVSERQIREIAISQIQSVAAARAKGFSEPLGD